MTDEFRSIEDWQKHYFPNGLPEQPEFLQLYATQPAAVDREAVQALEASMRQRINGFRSRGKTIFSGLILAEELERHADKLRAMTILPDKDDKRETCGPFKCEAAQRDGVLCADDECDIGTGVRTASISASVVVPEEDLLALHNAEWKKFQANESGTPPFRVQFARAVIAKYASQAPTALTDDARDAARWRRVMHQYSANEIDALDAAPTGTQPTGRES